jgi:hypothetical protein
MKLSATINFFNGEELLKEVILNIRPLVDHLSIIYQEYSNWNEELTDEAKQILNELISESLVDDVVCYQPNIELTPSLNEFNKREIGLKLAIKRNATHFLLMDADEFYDREQFTDAKQIIEIEDITYSCVHSYFYLRRPIYRSKLVDTTNVCFITKITPKLIFKYNQDFPVEHVDPTRRLINESGKFKLFDHNTITMHHMNFVRKDFNSKFRNTSSAENIEFIKNARNAVFQWKWKKTFSFPNKPIYEIIEVDDRFKLDKKFNKKTVFITNHFLKDFSGSEIAIYDLSKEFINLGFQVTIGSFKFDYPLKRLFDELDCAFLDLNKIDDTYDYKFDIIWAQHFTTIDKIFLDTKISSNFVIYSSLSPYESLESPPLCSEKINLFLANSHETRNKLLDMGLFDESIYVLPNPVSDNFFKETDRTLGKLKRIAVVSNHIPDEIREVITFLKNDGFDVVLYGLEGIFELITPSILEQYDAVITIGRTVQYCLAMGIPVYCYDRFGGCGWIISSNINEASTFNFSGRCTNRKLTVNEIVKEIKENYEFTKLNIQGNREFAEKNYKLSTHLKSILIQITCKIKYSNQVFFNISLRQRKYFVNELIKLDELNKYILNLNTEKEEQRIKLDELNKYILNLNTEKEEQRIKLDELNKYILNLNTEKEEQRIKLDELNNLKVVIMYKKIKSLMKRVFPKKIVLSNDIVHKMIRQFNKVDVKEPIFSVVIPVYDRTWELKDAVNSVLKQTFKNFEIILVCDGSPQETKDIVDELAEHPQIQIFKFDDNSGNACRGRNKGIELSKGKFIAFLDSDDLCISDRLEKTYKLFLEQNADMVSGSIEFIVDGSRKIDGIKNGKIAYPTEYDFELLKKYNLMYTCTVAIRKSCLEKYGSFRREMIYREDHELWLRLGYKGCKIVCTRDVLSKYRVHSGNAELKFIDEDDKWYQLMLDIYDKDYDWSKQ